MADDLLHEEGVAARLLDDLVLQGRLQGEAAEEVAHKPEGRIGRECLEPQALIVRSLGPGRSDLRTVGCDHENPVALNAAGKVGEELLRDLVHPVDVLDEHYERLFRAQGEKEVLHRLEGPELASLRVEGGELRILHFE